MDSNLLISAFFAVGVALLFLGLDLIISSRKIALQSRVDGYATLPQAPLIGEAKPGSKSKSKIGWMRSLQTELARADLPITPAEFFMATALLALLGLLIGWLIVGNAVIALLGLGLGLIAPRVYVGFLQRRRLELFDSELDTALTLLSNTLRSGYGLTQGLESVSKEAAPPLSVEFGRVVREVSLGLSLRDALANMTRRNPILDLELVVTAINVNHEVGGNLSEVLDRIATTIRDRIRMAGEIRAITAQQRLSAVVLVLLPVVLSLVIYVINPEYIGLLFQSTCGFVMVGTAIGMMIIGIFIIRRILAFRY